MSWRRQRWQYQVTTTGLPDSITTGSGLFESQWHQPYTDPQPNFVARLRAVAGVALIASGVFAPVVLTSTQEPGNSYESTYHQPWSEPVRLKPQAISRAYEQQTLAHVPFNEDFRIVTKWHQPWSEPPANLAKKRTVEFQAYTSGIVSTIEPGATNQSWQQSWSEPVRLRANVIRQDRDGVSEPFVFTAPETITVDKWFAPLSERPLVKQLATAQSDAWIGKVPICAPGVTTLSPSDKSGSLSLSDDNMMATQVSGNVAYHNVRATRGHSLGKWYFEGRVHNNNIPGGDQANQAIGVANTTAEIDGDVNNGFAGWDNNSIGFFGGGPGIASFAQLNGHTVFTCGTCVSLEEVQQFAVDCSTRLIWIRNDGNNWNGNPAADPATGVGGFDISVLGGGPLYPIGGTYEIPEAIYLNFGSFNYPIPSGFQAWDGSIDETQALGWAHTPWSEPVRRPFFQNSIQEGIAEPFVFTAAETVTVDKWFVSFQDPQRRKFFQNSIQEGISELGFPDTVSWYAPWREPVPPKPGLRAASQQALSHTPFVEDTTFESKWHFPWSEPVRVKPRATEFPSYTSGWDSTLEPGATYTTWYQRLSEPVRLKPRATDFPAYTAIDHFFEVVTVDKWFTRGPDFAPGKIGLRTASQQTLASVPFVEDTTLEAKWHTPWSEPVRVKPNFKAPEQIHYSPFVEDTTFESKWHAPWSDPVRIKPGLLAANQQFFQYGYVFTSEIVTVDKWFEPYANPVRLTPLRTVEFPIAVTPTQPQARDQIAWWQPLSVPQRLFKARAAEYQFLAFDPAVFVKIDWHNWLAEPVRLKPGLLVTEQSPFAAGFVPIIPSVTNWYEPLGEPVRFRVFPAHLQQAVAFTALTNIVQVIRFSRGYIIA